ncbi:hypothetical protein ONS95_000474 [Cadophora gregata]|uniref:uncharacterized protein n=1 Tax=Cadophora gregata TaxID=51156 RepID=UPI0026DC0994|nr:uncharacterized protein ONS95_000474 [Cadophora gregata]KAK0125518.1 hypothetical protein ONS96_009355 [Cadophora gregata f. sp. sojae]KAK0128502.1 hypothetical protein ONS95_000474 [Cadophora gregata]
MRGLLSLGLVWASCISSVASERIALTAVRNEQLKDGRIEERQQPGVVAANIFLRRGYHSSVVAGNYVYIDGGAFSYLQGGSLQILHSTTTLSIDMSKSWTNSSVVINSFSKPNGVPYLDDGTLWYNEKESTLQIGFTGAAARFNNPEQAGYPLGMWSFKLDGQGGGTWSQDTAATDAITSAGLTRPYQGLSAFGGDTAISIGGYENSRTVPENANVTDQIPIPGIVQYNMTTGTFTNSSAAGYNFNGTAERGTVHYIPFFGPKGVYIILSGDISRRNLYSAAENIQPFSTLTLYDPATGTFFNQTASGNIPNGRIEFCATGANSTNGTYEIFVYAGWAGRLGNQALPYDEMYILTLPAFQWIKVPYAPAKPRHGLTCETVGKRQMLVIGGVDTLQDEATNAARTLDLVTFSTRDQFTQGLAIFDMTTLTWSEQYDANAAAYEQSDPVKNFYASNPREPSTWASPTLKDLFSVTHFTNTSSPSSTSPANPTGTGTPDPDKKSSNIGAIVGGVVGGLAVLALIIGVFLFLRRRKRRAAASELPSNNTNYVAGGQNDTAYQGEYRGDHKPYAALMSEAPGSDVHGREGYPQELNSQPQHYEMDARQRHELA